MSSALTAGGVAIASADLCLAVFSWRRQSVLPGLLGVAGIALVAFAISSGPTGRAGQGALVIALILLLVGGALYAVGQALERLLDEEPEERS